MRVMAVANTDIYPGRQMLSVQWGVVKLGLDVREARCIGLGNHQVQSAQRQSQGALRDAKDAALGEGGG